MKTHVTEGRAPLFLGLVLAATLGASPAWGQERELPEEKAWNKKSKEAKEASAEAWKLIEAYGRGLPIFVSKAKARSRAFVRLDLDLVQKKPKDKSPELSHAATYRELSQYRDAILDRLRRLDPDRYPYKEERDRSRRYDRKLRYKFFDIHDLCTAPTDHHGPNIGLGMNEDKGGQFSDEEESIASGVNLEPEKLLELVEHHIGDTEGSLEVSGGRLVAQQRMDVLEKIEKFLETLREGRGGMIDLEVRVYRMNSTLFSKLRSSSTSLDAKNELALLNAVKKGTATLVAKNRVIAHDGQKVNVRRGDSRSIVADIEVNQTGVIPVQNPVIGVLHEGLLVEVRPLLDRKSQQVVVDVSLSLSNLSDKVKTRKVEKLELELAKMSISRTTSTACIPVGKGALLGGTFSRTSKDTNCVVYVKCRQILGKKSKTSKSKKSKKSK